MDTISFNKKEYPVRAIDMPNYGSVLISTEALNASLMNEDGSYKNKEANYVDEQIFFFVEESDLKLSIKKLITKIEGSQ